MASNNLKRWLVAVLTGTMMLGIAGCSTSLEHSSSSEYLKPEDAVNIAKTSGFETTEVIEGSFELTYQTDAYVTYTQMQSLHWENSQDRYEEILVSVGDTVKKGDVIATFEGSSSMEADVLERTLAVEEAQTALNKTIKNYENSIANKEKSLETLTGYDYQIADLELQKLESEYAQRLAESEYQIAKLQESLSEQVDKKNNRQLLAPFDGRIEMVSREFVKGNKVNTGSPIVIISDLDSQAMAFRNSNNADDVSYLSEVTLKDRVTGDVYTGKIVSCPNVTGKSGGDVIIELDEELPEGREDVYFKVDGCILQKDSVVMVNQKALEKEGNSYYVYVLNENGARYKTYVTIGKTDTNGNTTIIEGLLPGQQVVVD